jgi:hypothetical protein
LTIIATSKFCRKIPDALGTGDDKGMPIIAHPTRALQIADAPTALGNNVRLAI